MSLATFEQILTDAERSLQQASDLAALEAWHVRYFGKEKGEIAELLRGIPKLPPSERSTVGKAIHQAKQGLEAAFEAHKSVLEQALLDAQLREERLDVTLPGRKLATGHQHPILAMKQELIDIFEHYGFSVAEGPEIEDDWHNFTALNTPADHPARDAQDTFYIPGGWLLRTHTSSVQIRAMTSQKPPLRLIMPGRVYRRDEVTKRHYPIFHQLEGLMVGSGTHMGHLKGLLTGMLQNLFGRELAVRLRPSFFPFTEPSAEADVQCPFCAGRGCSTCSYSGWIELCGAGMVDPNVLAAVGYDPKEVTGLAFGLGIDRVAMIRYGFNDIRHLWENDLRFLQQF
ncbi:MAG: phenylalanine--tRNA ligase subunit alpha [Candidatus Sericytochromatia bacterium]|nr:phenylalanine--tRNA ligase subunit alpha [Candidatus Sericytochromatia bacterium]